MAELPINENREAILRIMRDSIMVQLWAIKSLNAKARAVLAADAIILGVLITGIGISTGISGDQSLAALWTLSTLGVVLITIAAVVSIAMILTSMYFCIRALKIIKVVKFNIIPFIKDNGDINVEKLEWCTRLKEEDVYKFACDFYISSIKVLEADNHSLASNTSKCQTWLFLGLLLGSIVVVVTFVLSLAASAPQGA